jgi:galactose oxidase-like protein
VRAAAALGVVALLLTACGSSDDDRRAPLRMLDARAVHTATGLADGSVLLAGGCATDGTALPDGRTLVAGGYDDSIRPSVAAALIG